MYQITLGSTDKWAGPRNCFEGLSWKRVSRSSPRCNFCERHQESCRSLRIRCRPIRLFLREIAAVHGALPPQQHGISLWVGTTLVVVGVVVNVVAAVKHWQTIQLLQKGQSLRFHPLSLEAIVALRMAFLGVVMAAYFVFGLNSSS